MRKYAIFFTGPSGHVFPSGLRRVFKLTAVLFFLTFSQVFATGVYSQTRKISLAMRSVSVREVLDKIESGTDYHFLYSSNIVDVDKIVNIKCSNQDIRRVLDDLFKDTDIEYAIHDKQIILSDKSSGEDNDKKRFTATGKVTDTQGGSLPGVNVLVKGNISKGTMTGENGSYRVEGLSSGDVLVFSCLGMQTEEVTVQEKKAVYDVKMKSVSIGLNEVVLVGYGIQKKKDVTGSTTRLTGNKLGTGISGSPAAMMQGKVSGVSVIQNSGEPGSGMSIRIRGANSIRSGQKPLYVIDGVPLDNSNLTPSGGSTNGIGGSAITDPLDFLNQDDIESIDILKDASATAIYGARGANGVILVTTKKGKEGRNIVSYNGYIGVSSIRKKLDLMSASEFRSYLNESGEHLLDEGASTNWQNKVLRTAVVHSNDVSLSGGTSKHTYRFSFGENDQQGIIKTTDMRKLNGKAMFSQKAINDKLTVTGNLIASEVKNRRAMIGETGGYEGDVILTMLKLNPTYPIYNPDGSYYQYSASQRNPLAMLELTNDITKTDRIIGNLSAEYEILKGFKYKINLGWDKTVVDRKINQDADLTYMTNGGEADINSISARNKLMESYLTYLKDIGNHHFNFLAGFSYQSFYISGSTMKVTGFEHGNILYTNNLRYGNFSNAEVGSYAEKNELQSFYGRINYNYKEKYLFTFTGRADGSSKFGSNNKYGFFPSCAFAWRASDENFIKNMNVFDNLKLRFSWGLTGNQEIPNKISLISVGTSADADGYFGGSSTTGITFSRVPNPDLKWETTEQFDLGFDFGVLDNRLTGTVDLFHKKTTNVLLELTAKAPAPTEKQWENVPGLKIINDGIEFNLNGNVIDKHDMSLNIGANFSTIRNRVKDLPVSYIATGAASGQGLGDLVEIITNDKPIGTFYGRVFEGFDSEGKSIYKTDKDGNEVKEYLGSALPDFTYGFSTNFIYKNIDFNMYWNGSQGNKVYNNTANALFYKPSLANGSNVTRDVASSKESEGNSTGFSSRYIENGSFLRLSALSIGYTLTIKSLSWLQSARFYVSGNNLLLITHYKGFDPEVNVDESANNVPSLGLDFTSYPKARSIMFGVNLKFK